MLYLLLLNSDFDLKEGHPTLLIMVAFHPIIAENEQIVHKMDNTQQPILSNV